MLQIDATPQETLFPPRRLQRDTYLGAAAITLAVGSLLSLTDWPLSVGLALVAIAFLGRAQRRRRVLRVATIVFAVALAWLYTMRTLESFGFFGFPFGERQMTYGHALVILSRLLTLTGVVLVAWAFAPRNEHSRRNLWLGLGAGAAAAGEAVAFLYYAFSPWQSAVNIRPFDWPRAFHTGGNLFLTLAFGTAALGFLLLARKSAVPAGSRLARREGLLKLACLGLCVSYVCAFVEVFAVFFPVMDESLAFIFNATDVLRALGAVGGISGAVLAAVAFSRSRRSSRSLEVDAASPAAAAGT